MADVRAQALVRTKRAGSRPDQCLQLAHLGCIFNKPMCQAEVAVHAAAPRGHREHMGRIEHVASV